ncbi:unnamed protein product, partial [Mesorhabditis belari]|uniref:Mediator of RNA polymerase II transcription subunit 18 n=1 Tax=Mesorhabditis belari TaxID=2138241 RepID=A0AAF3EDG7_9BILA
MEQADGETIAPSIPTTSYQCQELILFGSLRSEHVENLEARLAGLCDKSCQEFQEHELTCTLRVTPSATSLSSQSNVTVRLRRVFNFDIMNQTANKWHMRYMGMPEPTVKCPVIVRKVIDSVMHSVNMMEFIKALGLRMEYEYITEGKVYTCGKIKIVLNKLKKCESPGRYDVSHVKPFTNAVLVEVSTALPDGVEYMQEAKQLRAFADQLLPLVKMEKIEYWKK